MKIFKIEKFSLILFGLIVCTNFVHSQVTNTNKKTNDFPLIIPNDVLCNRVPSAACNLIENNVFNSNCFGINPFAQNCVQQWSSMSGSPQLNVFAPQLNNSSNHASMWARSQLLLNGTSIQLGEGIVTGIPKLTIGHKYTFSIYKRFMSNPAIPTQDLDEFNIILLKCSDYLAVRTSTENIPSLPVDSYQTIYCEKDVQNSSFQRINKCFDATDQWDIIWIFPKQNTYLPNESESLAWLEVTNLEIIDITNFNAGNNPTVTFPNCIANIGPTIPNCGLDGANFIWEKPDGTIYSQTGQNIQVDASNPINTGIWTLKMILPNIQNSPNSTCGLTCDIKSTVNVPFCNSNCVQLSGFFDGGSTCPNNFKVIVPYTQNYFCYGGDCAIGTFLESNYNSGNEWFINDVQINGVGGNIPNIGSVVISNNSKNLSFYLSGNSITQQIKFQVRNPSNGCSSLSIPTYVFAGTVPGGFIGYYKSNYINTFYTFYLNSAGPGAIYNWNVPGASIVNPNPTLPQVTLYFPTNIPTNGITGQCIISNSPYCNGTFNVFFDYNPNLFAPLDKKSENEQVRIKIYPNPTSSLLSITSTDKIVYVEFYTMANLLKKIIRIDHLKTINVNVSNLNPDIYVCKITTEKGVQYQKLILK